MTDLAAIRERLRELAEATSEQVHPVSWPYWVTQVLMAGPARDFIEAASPQTVLALLADTPSVEPLCEHEWEDALDDETAWYCPKCGLTEHPGEGVHEDDVLAWREACEAFEREMWPNGPASGSGSGVWAAHKDRLFRAAR